MSTRPPDPPLVAALHGEPDGQLWGVHFSRDGTTLAVRGSQGLTVWEVEGWRVRASIPSRLGVFSVALFPDGKSLAAAIDGPLRIWDLSTGESRVFPVRAQDTSTLALSPDAKLLAVGIAAGQNTVKLVDAAAGTELATLQGKTSIHHLAFSPDGQTLAAEDGPAESPSVGVIRLWDVATRRERATLGPYRSEVIYSMMFSPDGKTLATYSNNDNIHLWDPATAQLRASWKAGLGDVGHLAFSPDGRILLVGGGTLHPPELRLWWGRVQFWDVASGKHLRTLTAHDDTISSVALSPDGRLLAVASDYTNTVKVWDVSAITGKPPADLPPAPNPD